MRSTFYIFIAFVCVLLLYVSFSIEKFTDLKQIGTRYICPTRNQSYDIRGDIPIPRKSWPVYDSTIGSFQPELCTYGSLG